jgi:hypothetical protein
VAGGHRGGGKSLEIKREAPAFGRRISLYCSLKSEKGFRRYISTEDIRKRILESFTKAGETAGYTPEQVREILPGAMETATKG